MIKVVLYTSGPNVISKMIHLIQGNKHTHVALVLNYEYENIGDYDLLEIQNFNSKSRIVKLNETLKYCRVIKIVKIDGELDQEQIKKNLLDRKYSGFALFDACINHFIGIFKNDHEYKTYFANSKKKFTCSSLVATAIKLYGKSDVVFPTDLNTVEPDDFDKSPWKKEAVLDQDFQNKWR